jgi:membrane protein
MRRSEPRDTISGPLLWAAAIAAALFVASVRPRRFSATSAAAQNFPVREQERGRLASMPSDIPARGWKDILLRVFHNISDHRLMDLAAGVTFYGLLALFPAIAALVAIYGLFADPATLSADLDRMAGVLPGGAIEVIHDQLTRVVAQRGSTLGLTFIVSLAISLWSANAAMKSLFDTLNVVYSEREKRGLVRLNAQSLAFTIGGIAFIIVALGAMVVLPAVLGFLGLSGVTELLLRLGRWPALFVVLTLALAIIYRYGPSRAQAQWPRVTWGSAFAAFAWLVLSILFSWYAESFGSFNRTYGSLGAVIGFMTWIWLSAIVILIGAELDAEMEHRRTTPGALGTSA